MILKSVIVNETHSNQLPQKLAENLRNLLKKHNLNAHKLAQKLSLPKMTIGRLLSGETTDPRVSTLKLISDYFNISLDDLIEADRQPAVKALPKNQSHTTPKPGDKRAHYIFYKIVDSTPEEFILQCINTKTVFHLKIAEIVSDTDFLYGLHPIQACYIGIEYAKCFKKANEDNTLEKYCISRYGRYSLHDQIQNGDLCFICAKTSRKFIMDPRDIALSEELIGEFDAAQAFYIGLLAGLKRSKSHLWIVK